MALHRKRYAIKKRNIRLRNLEDFGLSYSDFEKIALTSLPPWPITQCTSRNRTNGDRCRSKFKQPGQTLCRFHFGHTMANRQRAIRRYMVWILCGFPSDDAMVFETLLSEQICCLMASNRLSQLPMVDQARFLSAVIEMSGIVESKDLEITDHG